MINWDELEQNALDIEETNRLFDNILEYIDYQVKQNIIRGIDGKDGKDGQPGVVPPITIGKVETIGAGDKAKVEINKKGDNYVLDFYIPRGVTGAAGRAGTGGSGSTYTAGLNIEIVDNVIGTKSTITGIDLMNFKTTGQSTTPLTEGQLRWNSEDKTLDIGMDGDGIVQQVGMETYYPRCINGSLEVINDGDLVMYDGTIGGSAKIKIKKATTAMALPGLAMGIATETIQPNETGRVTWFGLIRGISTDGSKYGETWTDGQVLYNSATIEGGLSKNKPAAPKSAVMVGIVVNAHKSNGILFVRPQYFPFVSHLSDVSITDPQDGQVLTYNFTNKTWENKTIPMPDMSEYYTKTEVDNIVSSVYKYKGSVATYAELPLINEIGDVYNVLDTENNYAWTGTSWDLLGGITPVVTENNDGLMTSSMLNDLNTIKLELDGAIEALNIIMYGGRTLYWTGGVLSGYSAYADMINETYISLYGINIEGNSYVVNTTTQTIQARYLDNGEYIYINSNAIYNGEWGCQINFAGDLRGKLYEVIFPIDSLITTQYPTSANSNDVEIIYNVDLTPWGQFGDGWVNATLDLTDAIAFGGNVSVQPVDTNVMVTAYLDATLTQPAFTTTSVSFNGYSIDGQVGTIPEGTYYLHIPVGYMELVNDFGNTNPEEYIIEFSANIFTNSFYAITPTIDGGNTKVTIENSKMDFNLVDTVNTGISAINYSDYSNVNILSATNGTTGIELVLEGDLTGKQITLMFNPNCIYLIGSDPIRTNESMFGRGFSL